MDWSEIAPMIVAVVGILTGGGVLVLRPISKRIGALLDLYARDKQAGLTGEVHQIRDLLETMNARLRSLAAAFEELKADLDRTARFSRVARTNE